MLQDLPTPHCKLLPFDKQFFIHWCLVPNVSSSRAQNPRGRPCSAHLYVWLVSLPLSNSLDSNLNRIFHSHGRASSVVSRNPILRELDFETVFALLSQSMNSIGSIPRSAYYAHLCRLERMLPLLHITLSMLVSVCFNSLCHWTNIFILSKELFYYNTP